MSATMTRQGARVQLELSDMRQELNVAKITKERVSRAAIEETKYLFTKQRAEVQEEMKRCVEFPGHNKLKAAIQRHPSSMPKWHRQESADTLETQQTRCTPTCPTQTADSRANSTSTRHATRPKLYHFWI
jgi:hypothetical protein